MNKIYDAAVLLARITVCAWFLPQGIEKIAQYSGTAGYMASQGVPGGLLPLVIATEIICALAILIGWRTRLFALLLAGFIVLAVALFHLPPADMAEQTVVWAELVGAAGLLVLFAHGAGNWSLDAVRARNRSAGGTPSLSSSARS